MKGSSFRFQELLTATISAMNNQKQGKACYKVGYCSAATYSRLELPKLLPTFKISQLLVTCILTIQDTWHQYRHSSFEWSAEAVLVCTHQSRNLSTGTLLQYQYFGWHPLSRPQKTSERVLVGFQKRSERERVRENPGGAIFPSGLHLFKLPHFLSDSYSETSSGLLIT